MEVLPIRKSFSLSLIFHAFLFGALIVTIVLAPPNKPPTTLNLQQSDKIVQAVSVNQAQVEQEMSMLKNQQSKNQAAEQAKLAALNKQAAKAAQLKAQQEKALAKLKVQQDAAMKQQQAQLAAIKQQQQAAQKQLDTIQKSAQQAAVKQQQKVNEQKQLQLAAEKSLQQQLTQQATQLDEAKQQQINSQLAKYTELIRQAIGQEWIIPPNINPSLYCILEIKLAAGGVVSNVTIKQSSGDSILDRSAITAVYRASPLPVPSDPSLFKQMQDINLKVQPNAVIK
ncbi:MAG: cell envelope integrity protein TolA [Legionellales bacterium]|nr:cell envelope integrity protein TolA [Legionellales bacterium]